VTDVNVVLSICFWFYYSAYIFCTIIRPSFILSK